MLVKGANLQGNFLEYAENGTDNENDNIDYQRPNPSRLMSEDDLDCS